MLRMMAHRKSQTRITTGTDRVLFGLSLPQDTVVHRISGVVDIKSAQLMGHNDASYYAMRGYVLPVIDPDSTLNYDTLWDQYVPKEIDSQVFDLDTAAIDTTPFFEPGEADWTNLLDVGLRPRRVFDRKRLLTMRDSVFQYQDNQTPFGIEYMPGDRFSLDVRSKIRVRQPSILVFGLASLSLDDTTATVGSTLTENKWSQVKYMGHVLERAMMDFIGLTEAGATTPWEEATDLL